MKPKKRMIKQQFSMPLVLKASLVFFISLLIITLIVLFLNWPNIKDIGPFGDAFNGLLAPIISFIAALLVYVSFKEQIKANEMIQEQWTLDVHLRSFNDIKSNFSAIKIYLKSLNYEKDEIKEGVEALRHILDYGKARINGDQVALMELRNILMELRYLLDLIEKSKLEGKYFLRFRIELFYKNYLKDINQSLVQKFIETKQVDEYSQLIIAIRLLEEKFDEINPSFDL